MFGSKKTPEPKKTGLASLNTGSSGLNSLVQETAMEGNINAKSDFRVDGSIIGNINCTSKVIIGASGKVTGEIFCRSAVIEGSVKGKLNVEEVLDVRESASIDGEIKTGKLVVASGAKFNVSCQMGNSAKPISNKAKEPVS